MDRTEAPARVDDPLREPTWPIFIYAAWAFTSWYVDQWLGLLVLVTATALLALAAVRAHALSAPDDVDDAPFMADFNTVLLFCSAGIAAAVLLLEALDRSPELFFAGLAYAAAAGFVLDHRRRLRRDARAA